MKKTWCLAIETASTRLGLSLLPIKTGERPSPSATSVFLKQPLRQSDGLFPELTKLLRKKRLSQADLGLIAVNAGPGSFTGVRVGVAAGRALAQSLNIPAVGVNTLECLAFQTRLKEKSVVGAVLPALAGEAYFALYEIAPGARKIKTIIPPLWADFGTIRKKLSAAGSGRKIFLTAEDVDKARLKTGISEFPWLGKNNPVHPSTVGLMGLRRFNSSRTKLSYGSLHPVYLQPSWAEREKLKRR